MAAALRFAADITADDAYDDGKQHGDDPLPKKMAWELALLDLYPRNTWNADPHLRRPPARAYDAPAVDCKCGSGCCRDAWPRSWS